MIHHAVFPGCVPEEVFILLSAVFVLRLIQTSEDNVGGRTVYTISHRYSLA